MNRKKVHSHYDMNGKNCPTHRNCQPHGYQVLLLMHFESCAIDLDLSLVGFVHVSVYFLIPRYLPFSRQSNQDSVGISQCFIMTTWCHVV